MKVKKNREDTCHCNAIVYFKKYKIILVAGFPESVQYNNYSSFVKDRTVTPRCFRDVATGIGGVGEIQCRRWSFDIKKYIYIFIYRGTVNPNTVHTT